MNTTIKYPPDYLESQQLMSEATEVLQETGLTPRQLAKELAIAKLKNAGTLANNLCPDCRDKQVGKPCLGCTIQTLEHQRAELLATLEQAVATIGDLRREHQLHGHMTDASAAWMIRHKDKCEAAIARAKAVPK